MREGLMTLSEDMRIIAINKAACKVFGAPVDMAGKNIIELTRDMEFLEKVKQAAGGTGNEILITNGRSYRAYINNVADLSGISVIVIFADVTDSEQAGEMRRAFTANVSHELKTPLTSIAGFAELLMGGGVGSDEVKRLTKIIHDEAVRMAALADDIMLLSKLDETDGRRDFEDADLSEIADEAIAAKQGQAAQKNISIFKTGGSLAFSCNRALLFDLLVNLIDNAIKYNITDGSINVNISKINGAARITVSDTGIGIPEQHLPRIFERFYRVDPSRSKKTGGTGLGLSIVKHIAKYHNGVVTVESGESAGTTVTVILPEN
jgi:two-component system phosphate regulon sensor histidine kinase PhoR